jgi:hypothetical protein
LSSLTACDQFTPPGWAQSTGEASATATPTATCSNFGYESVFSAYGSVHYTLVLASGLTMYVDMWTEQKAHEWYPDTDKQLNYVINVVDSHAEEDDPFRLKRRVYLGEISVQAETVQTSGESTVAYELDDDAVDLTLDPEALRSKKYGLLVTSPKGGFQYQKTEIGQVPEDTKGLDMNFDLELSTQDERGSKDYTTDNYKFTLPIAIFTQATANDSTSCASNATLEPEYAPSYEG